MAASSANQPPVDCGRRLIPHLIDELAVQQPQKTFISISRSSNPQDGFEDVSFAVLARAINRAAWWLEGIFGRSQSFETIYTQLPPHDLRHVILVVAAAKVGYKMFFSSPVNTIENHVALLEKVDCNIFLLPSPRPALAKQILERRAMSTVDLPSMNFWLREPLQQIEPYPFTKTFEEARMDPFMAFHSSGTTGTPKPLVYKHGSDAAVDAYQLLPLLGDHPETWGGFRFRGKRVFTCQPFFHACGIPFLMNAAIFYDFVGAVMPPILKYDANIVSAVHRHGNVQVSYLNPATIIAISQSPQHIANLRHIEMMSFAGGPLPKAVGDKIQNYTDLVPIFGSTECSSMAVAPPPTKEDWQYHRFSPFLGTEFRHYDQDLYELVYVRNKFLAPFQPMFCTVDDAGDEFHTRDLFRAHPTRPGWWQHSGRRDDVLVFTDGRKLNPVRMEAKIETHPSVNAAIICGHGRARPSVLVQTEAEVPTWTSEQQMNIIDDIWPTVEAAMADAPLSGRLDKDMILFTSPTKPMVRSGMKITVQRMKTLALYKGELDGLYNSVAQSSAPVKANTIAGSGVPSYAHEQRKSMDMVTSATVVPHYVYGFGALEIEAQ